MGSMVCDDGIISDKNRISRTCNRQCLQHYCLGRCYFCVFREFDCRQIFFCRETYRNVTYYGWNLNVSRYNSKISGAIFLGIISIRSLLYANNSSYNNNRPTSLFQPGKTISRHSRVWYNRMDCCRVMHQFAKNRNGSSTNVAGCNIFNYFRSVQFSITAYST